MTEDQQKNQNQGKGQGRGWHGDSEEHARVGSLGGQAQGQENNPGNFANDPEKAREAGRKGGQASQGQSEDEE